MKELIGEFVFWYPYLMSMFWIAGVIVYLGTKERSEELNKEEYEWPPITILLPCYNEEDTAAETIDYLSKLSYPNFEIIAINDGSRDKTGDILIELVDKYHNLRVIDCKENKGKANALHMGAHASRYEYLVCIDSDAILDDDAPYYMIRQFLKNGERVGAVTGNPRIRNRDTLLGKLQLVEYASIIGSIKRTQRVLGKLMTVSGVVVTYRKKALVSVGLWDRDMITEDIAVSWKLQKEFWDLRYEPKALCWMLVPEKISSLCNQRIRWAQGGQEVLLRHWDIFKDWRQRRLWPLYIEQLLSIIWAVLWLGFTIYTFITATHTGQFVIWLGISAFALTFQSIIQLGLSLITDSNYDDVSIGCLSVAWYPVAYWIINTYVAIRAIPRAIKSKIKGGYATWESPDRGERKELEEVSEEKDVREQEKEIHSI